MQLNVFFPTNALYSLKSFISATSNVNFYFFFHSLDSERRTFRARHVKMINNNFLTCSTKMLVFLLAIWFIPQIPKPTSDWEWHKTSRSRVHPVKTRLIILHVPTFYMGFSKKCLRWTLNWQRQGVRAEGKTSCMKFELFQNSCCHFSQF